MLVHGSAINDAQLYHVKVSSLRDFFYIGFKYRAISLLLSELIMHIETA